MVPLERDEVLEGRDAVEFGGVNEAHEHIADLGAGQRLVEQGVLPMQDRSRMIPPMSHFVRICTIRGTPRVARTSRSRP
jgi:hypothetical protein